MTRDEIIEKVAKQRCIDNGWTLDRTAREDSCFRHDDLTPWWKARYEPQIRREIEDLEKIGFIVTEPPLHGVAQSPWPITDVMCEAAISADVADRIQGFSYEKRHVIRDVWMPPQEQELWSAPVAGPDEYQAFQRQCRIERMRRVIAAALWPLQPGSLQMTPSTRATCKFCGTVALPNDEPNCSSLDEAYRQTPTRPYGCPWFDKDARKANPAPIPSIPASTDAGALADEVWQELINKDDRTSPEEYPEMALITSDELADFMSRAAPQQSPRLEREPFAWVILSEETGNTRMWTRNGDIAKAFAAKHLLECIELYRSSVTSTSRGAQPCDPNDLRPIWEQGLALPSNHPREVGK